MLQMLLEGSVAVRRCCVCGDVLVCQFGEAAAVAAVAAGAAALAAAAAALVAVAAVAHGVAVVALAGSGLCGVSFAGLVAVAAAPTGGWEGANLDARRGAGLD